MNTNLFWQLGKYLFKSYFNYSGVYPNLASDKYTFSSTPPDIPYSNKSFQISKQTISEKPKKVVLNMQGRSITITDNYGYTEIIDLIVYFEKEGNWYYYILPRTFFETNNPAQGLTRVNFLQDFEFDFSYFGTSQNYNFYLIVDIEPFYNPDWNSVDPDSGIYEPIHYAYTQITDKTNAPYLSYHY